jgi:lipoate-protein ligase A
MQLLDRTLATLAANLALDEALLLDAEAGRADEGLRFWEWPQPAVVLGSGCVLADDVDEAACRADAVPILRRSSGGGTVLLGAGCLCYSLILAYDRSPLLCDVRPSYVYILERIREALAGILPDLELAGTSDLATGDRKVSGNAQQRKRHFLLHHGTLLYDFESGLAARYLRLPARQPDYRGGRDHVSFLRNLPTAADDLKHRLARVWHADTPVTAWPESRVAELVADKYTRPDWIQRR